MGRILRFATRAGLYIASAAIRSKMELPWRRVLGAAIDSDDIPMDPDELAQKLMAINTVALPAIMAGEYAFQWALKRPT